MTTATIERRGVVGLDVRDTSATEAALTALIVPYNRKTSISDAYGRYAEQFAPRSCARAIRERQSVPMLQGHDTSSVPLARFPGSLSLEDTPAGLSARTTLDPSNPQAAAVISAVRRGDLSGCSISFCVPEGGDSWSSDWTERTVNDCDLVEVSLTAFPAYGGTEVGLRSIDDEDFARAHAIVAWADAEQRAGRKLSAASLERLGKARKALKQAQSHLKILGKANSDIASTGSGLDNDAGGGSSSSVNPADALGPRSASPKPSVQRAIDTLLDVWHQDARRGANYRCRPGWEPSRELVAKWDAEQAADALKSVPGAPLSGRALIRRHAQIRDAVEARRQSRKVKP